MNTMDQPTHPLVEKTIRLTGQDAGGYRWSPDRTVRVEARFENPGMWADRRNKPVGYEILDIFTKQTASVQTLAQVRAAVQEIMATRPSLQWGPWSPPENERHLRYGRGGTILVCTADSPAGPVKATLSLRGRPDHPGMWQVSFDLGVRSFGWLSDIRWIPHRMLQLQAHAAHAAHKTGACDAPR
jgi:hypothetical protein